MHVRYRFRIIDKSRSNARLEKSSTMCLFANWLSRDTADFMFLLEIVLLCRKCIQVCAGVFFTLVHIEGKRTSPSLRCRRKNLTFETLLTIKKTKMAKNYTCFFYQWRKMSRRLKNIDIDVLEKEVSVKNSIGNFKIHDQFAQLINST